MSRRERDLSAFCCAARRELRFEPSAERDEEMRARLSLSGAMWNWFVVSEMSWEVEVLVGVCEGVGGGGGGMHCYGVFVEENHLVMVEM